MGYPLKTSDIIARTLFVLIAAAVFIGWVLFVVSHYPR